MDDTQIINLYFDRNESAIQETAAKYGAYLNQISYTILRSREDTEEILEDTYLAAWNTIPPTIPAVLRHYLSRITRNLSFSRLDYLTAKRRNRHLDVLLSELDTCIPDHRGNTEELWEAKQIGIALNRFLNTLDCTDCRIFLSRYYYGMTIGEISKRYNIPERKVKYRLSCLRKHLRIHLEKEGVVV